MAKLFTFTDAFTGTDLDLAKWNVDADGVAPVVEAQPTGPDNWLRMPTDVDPIYSEVFSNDLFDATDSGIAVQVWAPDPGLATSHYLFFNLYDAGLSTGFGMYADATTLTTSISGSDTSSAPYDPSAQRWWAICESAGVVAFFTSADGAVWTELFSNVHGLDATALMVVVEAIAYDSSAGFSAIANLNTGVTLPTVDTTGAPVTVTAPAAQISVSTPTVTAGTPLAKLSTFTDALSTAPLDSANWDVITGTPVIASGNLRLPFTSVSASVRSVNAFDATDTYGGLLVYVPALGNNTYRFALVDAADATVFAMTAVSDGTTQTLNCVVGATATPVGPYAGNQFNPLWWVILEAAGTVGFFVAVDGAPWTLVHAAVHGLDATTVKVSLSGVATDIFSYLARQRQLNTGFTAPPGIPSLVAAPPARIGLSRPTVAQPQHGDALVFVDPDTGTPAAADFFHWGPVAPGDTADRRLQVANISVFYRATAVSVSTVDVAPTTVPTAAATHLLSRDGLRFGATVDLGDLEPGQRSDVLTLRRVTPADAASGAWAFDVRVHATTWS